METSTRPEAVIARAEHPPSRFLGQPGDRYSSRGRWDLPERQLAPSLVSVLGTLQLAHGHHLMLPTGTLWPFFQWLHFLSILLDLMAPSGLIIHHRGQMTLNPDNGIGKAHQHQH